LSCEKAVSSYDQAAKLTLAYDVELPFGPGKRFGSGWHGVTKQVLGGWQLSGILTLFSGMPIPIYNNTNTSDSFGGSQHPNLVGDPSLGCSDNLNEWFNVAAFATPASFTFGNMGRTLTSCREGGQHQWDFSLFKNFNLTERVKLQLRSEAYNLLNTPAWGLPSSSIGSSSAGVVSSQPNPARTINIAAKLIF
jgi:hypothetical protein